MTAPVLTSVQYLGTELFLIFDRAISATSAASITATVTPTGVVNALTFVGAAGNTLALTLAAPLSTGQGLDLVIAGGNTILDQATGLDSATPATKSAVKVYAAPTVMFALVGQSDDSDITVQFSEPVAAAAGNLAAGFTVLVDSVPVTGTITATSSSNQTQVILHLPADISYKALVSVSYNSSTGSLATQLRSRTTSGTTVGGSGTGNLYGDSVSLIGGATQAFVSGVGAFAASIGSFTVTAINRSTSGLPTSNYPLSTTVKAPLVIAGGSVTAQLTVGLNPVDVLLVEKYGPVRISTGGSFGITVENPQGIYATDVQVTLSDGAVLKQVFSSGINPAAAVVAANDWCTVITSAISQALGQARAIDSSVGSLVGGVTSV